MKIISPEHLRRNLKALGALSFFAFLFSILIIFSPDDVIILGIILASISLTSALGLFSLSVGVSRKERWAGICGLIWFGLSLLSVLISFLAGTISLLILLIVVIIAALFLASFVKYLKEGDLKNKISKLPFALVLLSLLMLLLGGVADIFLSHEIDPGAPTTDEIEIIE